MAILVFKLLAPTWASFNHLRDPFEGVQSHWEIEKLGSDFSILFYSLFTFSWCARVGISIVLGEIFCLFSCSISCSGHFQCWLNEWICPLRLCILLLPRAMGPDPDSFYGGVLWHSRIPPLRMYCIDTKALYYGYNGLFCIHQRCSKGLP